jgi:hypothetical protein
MPALKTALKLGPVQRQSPELVLAVARLRRVLAEHEPERLRWR